MVYTVTLSPALDYVMQLEKLCFEDINRSYFENLRYGGKGINVSVVLTRLGVENKALGLIAGFTGEQLEKMLVKEGVNCSFLKLKSGNTRINVKIKAQKELDINARGPAVSKEETEAFFKMTDEISAGDYLVLAGSVPENLPDSIYGQILDKLKDRGVNFVVDATKNALTCSLKYKPFLIKPNNYELGELFGVSINTDEEAVTYAKKLQRMGAKNVLVSRGSKGAVLLDESGTATSIGAVKGEVVNTVGCGDSMVAGFLAGYIEKGDYKYALRLGAACGNATAFCDALAEAGDIQNVFKKIKIN